jgi:gamma-glutamyltranspeptidase/glutathione hydrolase
VTALDGVGPVGSLATIEDYRDRADDFGIHQANVPGAWDGWMQWLNRYGRLDLGIVLAPAIRTARVGFPASHHLVFWLRDQEDLVLGLEPAARIYAPEGRLVEIDELVFQREMANTFEAISIAYANVESDAREDRVQAARDYVYRGPVARALVELSDAEGGYFTFEDFAGFSAEIVPSIHIPLDERVTVHQNPPNSQGIVMLLALNILNGFDFSGLSIDDPNFIHLQVEALKLAFADRFAYVGDPDRIDVPVEALLSDEHAQAQRLRIDMQQAMEWPIAANLAASRGGHHTSTFHVLDGEGNAAAVTTSLGAQFLVVGDTGIHINERMRFLSIEEGNANQLTPGFKVRHTSSPYMALRDGRPYVIGGNTGVDTQPQAQLQQLMAVWHGGLSAQEVIDRPRFVSQAFPTTTYPYDVTNRLALEEGFSDEVIEDLTARGHDVVVGEGIFGTAQMLVIPDDGSGVDAGAESRSRTAAAITIDPAPTS